MRGLKISFGLTAGPTLASICIVRNCKSNK
jgi:hypothetical protein